MLASVCVVTVPVSPTRKRGGRRSSLSWGLQGVGCLQSGRRGSAHSRPRSLCAPTCGVLRARSASVVSFGPGRQNEGTCAMATAPGCRPRLVTPCFWLLWGHKKPFVDERHFSDAPQINVPFVSCTVFVLAFVTSADPAGAVRTLRCMYPKTLLAVVSATGSFRGPNATRLLTQRGLLTRESGCSGRLFRGHHTEGCSGDTIHNSSATWGHFAMIRPWLD